MFQKQTLPFFPLLQVLKNLSHEKQTLINYVMLGMDNYENFF